MNDNKSISKEFLTRGNRIQPIIIKKINKIKNRRNKYETKKLRINESYYTL